MHQPADYRLWRSESLISKGDSLSSMLGQEEGRLFIREHGGWPVGGPMAFDLSWTVAYWAIWWGIFSGWTRLLVANTMVWLPGQGSTQRESKRHKGYKTCLNSSSVKLSPSEKLSEIGKPHVRTRILWVQLSTKTQPWSQYQANDHLRSSRSV